MHRKERKKKKKRKRKKLTWKYESYNTQLVLQCLFTVVTRSDLIRFSSKLLRPPHWKNKTKKNTTKTVPM